MFAFILRLSKRFIEFAVNQKKRMEYVITFRNVFYPLRIWKLKANFYKSFKEMLQNKINRFDQINCGLFFNFRLAHLIFDILTLPIEKTIKDLLREKQMRYLAAAYKI